MNVLSYEFPHWTQQGKPAFFLGENLYSITEAHLLLVFLKNVLRVAHKDSWILLSFSSFFLLMENLPPTNPWAQAVAHLKML